ncbi:MAG: hypothetical protein JOZ49_00730 [Mycolicibacterium sp.]|nr:hypothetical protein [Mycolicibacterium sp.]
MTDPSIHVTGTGGAVRQQLHGARLRTVFIRADRRLTTKSAVGIPEALEVAGVVLVGDRFGAELGWKLAATHPNASPGWWWSTAGIRGWPM